MRRLVVLLVPLLLAPLAMAMPVASVGNTYVGIAHVGSHDTELDWDYGRGCTEALEWFRYTLVVESSTPTDTLLLEVEDVERGPMRAVAMPGSPAVIEVLGPDGCPHFAVRGVVVAGFVPYTLVARSLGYA